MQVRLKILTKFHLYEACHLQCNVDQICIFKLVLVDINESSRILVTYCKHSIEYICNSTFYMAIVKHNTVRVTLRSFTMASVTISRETVHSDFMQSLNLC